jgi:putative sigma-54 modulation protein
VDVRIHGSHTDVPEDLKELATDKVTHATRVFDDPAATADVEFSEERNPRIADRYRVEITATVAGHLVRIEEAAPDDRSALESAVDRFERQLRRLKERLIQRSRQPREKRLNAAAPGVETSDEEDHGPRIDRVKRFVVKPMTPEEAALQMELLEHSFYLFLNAETDRYSVVYRRRGDSLGLLEPE